MRNGPKSPGWDDVGHLVVPIFHLPGLSCKGGDLHCYPIRCTLWPSYLAFFACLGGLIFVFQALEPSSKVTCINKATGPVSGSTGIEFRVFCQNFLPAPMERIINCAIHHNAECYPEPSQTVLLLEAQTCARLLTL